MARIDRDILLLLICIWAVLPHSEVKDDCPEKTRRASQVISDCDSQYRATSMSEEDRAVFRACHQKATESVEECR